METRVFIRRKADSSRQEGPFSQEEFLDLVEAGTILFGDYAWKTGMPNWVLAGSLALAFRNRYQDRDVGQPPDLVFGQKMPPDEAEQRELFLRLDRVKIFPHMPPECAETGLPLNLVLSSGSQMPGGKTWRRLAADLTRLFAARVRFEQAGLLHPHPLRVLIGDKNLDHELEDGEIALLATDQLKRRVILLGGDLLVNYAIRFDFISDHAHPHQPSVPVVIASGTTGFTAEAVQVRRAAAHMTGAAGSQETHEAIPAAELDLLKTQLAERERQMEEREAFLMDAEARLMNKIEEQQIKEVELAQLEDNLRAREAALRQNG